MRASISQCWRVMQPKFPSLSCLLTSSFMQRHLSEHDNSHIVHNRVRLQRLCGFPQWCYCLQKQNSALSCTEKATLSVVGLALQVSNIPASKPNATRLNFSWRQFTGDFCCLCKDGTWGWASHTSWIYVFNVELLSDNILFWSPGHHSKRNELWSAI